jgi:hypothetical protein
LASLISLAPAQPPNCPITKHKTCRPWAISVSQTASSPMDIRHELAAKAEKAGAKATT